MQHSKPMIIQAITWHTAPDRKLDADIRRILVESEAPPVNVAMKFAADHLQYWLTGLVTLNAKLTRAEQEEILKRDPVAEATLPTSPMGHNYCVLLNEIYRGEKPLCLFSGAGPQELGFWRMLHGEPDIDLDLITWATDNPAAAAEVLDDMRSSPKCAEIFSYESAKRFAEAIESVSTSKAA